MSTIVVIEDDVQTARMVAKLLRSRGHTVHTAQSGEEGFLRIMADMPNLILIDLGLPDIDRQTIIRIIRQQSDLAAIPVVAFTAWPPAIARKMAQAYGCDGVITKPIDTQTFPQQIGDLCNRPRKGTFEKLFGTSRRIMSATQRAVTSTFFSDYWAAYSHLFFEMYSTGGNCKNPLVGVLDIPSELANRFAQSDVSIMTPLSGQIAVAAQNARSYQKEVQMVDQLQTVDRLKSEFLASRCHELRTPLNSIIGYSRMLLDGSNGELEEETYEDIDAIYNSGQHLLHLINDILDLAKIEAEKLEIDPEPVDFSTTAKTVMQMTSVLLKDKPVKFILNVHPQLPTLQADPKRLRQILNNLVSNAVKFTSEGEIRIQAQSQHGLALISVKDSGMGIAPDQSERIFERFQQADSSST